MKKWQKTVMFILGWIFVILGLVGAYYGPMEISCFYFFSTGGSFHYSGFGVGTLWFAYLIFQNSWYYIVAAIFIPLGIGYMKRRAWAFILTKIFIWCWLGMGVYLAINCLALLPDWLLNSIEIGLNGSQLAIWGSIAALGTIALPIALLLILYRCKAIKTFFEISSDENWLERTPITLLMLYLLYLILIFGYHLLTFLQYLFPLFGKVMLGRPAVPWLTISTVISGILLYGLIKKSIIAWWASIGVTAAQILSTLLSFSGMRLADIFIQMNLPEYEQEFLISHPLIGQIKPVILFACPLLAILILTFFIRKHMHNRRRDYK